MKYLLIAIRTDGLIYALRNYRDCISHYANQERLARESADPVRQEAIARYVNALHDAGDLR
jgi:hypothetical protein